MTSIRLPDVPTSSLFRLRDFRLLLVGRTSSTAASAITWVLLPLYVYDTTGSAAAAGLMSAMNVLPFVLFGLPVGALVDRLPVRRVLVVVEIVDAAIMLLVPVALVTSEVPHQALLAIGFLTSTAFVWFEVASAALVPEVAGAERVFQANGYLWSATTVVNAVAAPAGFILLDKLGLGTTFAILAAGYVGSAVLAWFLRSGRVRITAQEDTTRLGRADLLAGIGYIRSDPTVRALTTAGLGVGISGGAVYMMIVVHADTALGLAPGDSRVAWIIAASSVGAVGASVIAPRLRRRAPVSSSAVVLAADVLLMVGYAWSPNWIAALVLVAGWNLAHTIVLITSISVRQQRCPPELQGRVNAVGRLIAWGAVPLGGGLCGLLIDSVQSSGSAITVMALPALVALLHLTSSARRIARSTRVSQENLAR